MATLRLRVNAQVHTLQAEPALALLHALREDLHLVGTRQGCGAGECGACLVLVDGQALNACTTPLWAVQGKDITTVEGLGAHLREAFIAEQAGQCGFCSSGMLIAAAALLARQAQPSAADVRRALEPQLCRCGAHNRIVRAVLRAAAAAACAVAPA